MAAAGPTAPTAAPDDQVTSADAEVAAVPVPAGRVARGTTIDRYVVLDHVGEGGMGVVYVAYDPDLDRKVAVKLLHRVGDSAAAQAVARARMLREAQSLAKLSHPNVVTIHDVGTLGEQAWIAMEFVEGQTLSVWLRGAPRPWAEVLDVLLAAGDGVAAAHAAGVLHRDLKPDNIMVDDDGRARVMDFGLARGHEADVGSDPHGGSVSSPTMLRIDVTRAGAIIGTPAYMAPEQLAGGNATPASDQFSFCVTLWEALYGTRPFTGTTLHEQLAMMLDAPPQRGDRRVPTWLRRVLERGLSRRADARHPRMAALLDALRTGRQRATRRRILGVAVGVAAIGLGVAGLGQWRQRAALAECDAAADRMASQWPGRADEILDTLTRGRLAFAAATAERLPPWFDRFASRWADATREVCVATAIDRTLDAEQSTTARACLDTHAIAFEVLLDSLAEGSTVAARTAVRAAANLADPSTCTDVRAMARSRWAHDVDDRRVAELRQRLARADAIAAVGRPADALEIDDAVATETVALGLAALGAEAALARGRHLSELDRLPEAEAALGQAYFDALRLGDDATAARAALWQVRTVGNRLGRHDEGLMWGLHAAAVLERSGTESPLDRATLDAQIAAVLREKGELDRAVALDRSALATREEILGEDHPDVADSLDNLGNVLHLLRDEDGAAAAQRRALEIRERVFGPWHPMVAASLNNLANIELAADRFAVAEPLLMRALEIGEAELGTDNADVAAALANLGTVYMGEGRYEEAERFYRRGLAIEERILGSDHHEVAGSYANLSSALMAQGDHRGAASLLERASTIARRRLAASHPILAIIDFNLGLARVGLGEYAAAEAAFRSAAAIPSSEGIDLQAAVHVATALRLQGRLDDADRELDRAEAQHASREVPRASFAEDVAVERGLIAGARAALGPVRRR